MFSPPRIIMSFSAIVVSVLFGEKTSRGARTPVANIQETFCAQDTDVPGLEPAVLPFIRYILDDDMSRVRAFVNTFAVASGVVVSLADLLKKVRFARTRIVIIFLHQMRPAHPYLSHIAWW